MAIRHTSSTLCSRRALSCSLGSPRRRPGTRTTKNSNNSKKSFSRRPPRRRTRSPTRWTAPRGYARRSSVGRLSDPARYPRRLPARRVSIRVSPSRTARRRTRRRRRSWRRWAASVRRELVVPSPHRPPSAPPPWRARARVASPRFCGWRARRAMRASRRAAALAAASPDALAALARVAAARAGDAACAAEAKDGATDALAALAAFAHRGGDEETTSITDDTRDAFFPANIGDSLVANGDEQKSSSPLFHDVSLATALVDAGAVEAFRDAAADDAAGPARAARAANGLARVVLFASHTRDARLGGAAATLVERLVVPAAVAALDPARRGADHIRSFGSYHRDEPNVMTFRDDTRDDALVTANKQSQKDFALRRRFLRARRRRGTSRARCVSPSPRRSRRRARPWPPPRRLRSAGTRRRCWRRRRW